MQAYLKTPNNFELRSGLQEGAPNCPFGNKYQWVGYDKSTDEFVRFTKSVFKKLIPQDETTIIKNRE